VTDLSLIGALTVAVGSLAGATTWMFRWFVMQFDELKKEVITCRQDRENLWQRITQINNRLDSKE
jgi:hypothetical protein